MSKSKPDLLLPIDLGQLSQVTGGKHGDPLLNDLSTLATQIKDVTAKTNGFSSSQMLLLCALVMQRNNASSNILYVNRGGSRFCW